MKITLREVLIISLFLFIVAGITWTGCNKINNYKQEIAKQEQNITALKDTVKLINGNWEEFAVESNLKVLDISTVNDSLKNYIKYLKKEKNLLVATKIKVVVTDTITDTIYKETISTKEGFDEFNVTGTEGNLEYNQNIFIKDSLALVKLTYTYNLNMAMKYNRLPDGSIKTTYSFDDPNVILTESNSFYVPATKTKRQIRSIKALKWTACILTTGLATYAGYTLGTKISK
jgi:hypothetical protein